MEDVLLNKLLIAALGILVAVVGYLLKSRIDRAEADIKAKVDTAVCSIMHNGVVTDVCQLRKHRHAPLQPSGQGGEVIL